jgi:hypothetical protein
MTADTPTALERLLGQSIAEQAAIDAAWRWMRRSRQPIISLSEIVARVQRRAPDADPADIKYEIERRMQRRQRVPVGPRARAGQER